MSWSGGTENSPFGVANLPFGSFVTGPRASPRLGVRIGDAVLDVGDVARRLVHPDAGVLSAPVLNPLMANGPAAWTRVRDALTAWLTEPEYEEPCRRSLFRLADVELRLPLTVGDYVDFYSSEHHASNAGKIFRPEAPGLPANWRHQPIGYHGRAGSVAVSGTPVRRPSGQHRVRGEDAPIVGPSRELDLEAEVCFVVGVGSDRPVPLGVWRDHVFGVCLLNDWSARDIQAFESVPLGPFLGKSFLTSISPWVVPLAALEAARTPMPPRPVPLAGYLDDTGEEWGLDISLEVALNGEVISRPPFATMYWSPAQQLAHLTVNGAPLRCGDLFASGTVSGPAREQWGSLLELSWRGATPVALADGSSRGFLEDGDTVSITATAPGPDGSLIGFGEVSGTIVPS